MESNDPRYAKETKETLDRIIKRGVEKVLDDAKTGNLLLFPQGNSHAIRVMDLVRFLADDGQRHYPVTDYFWRHAYRRIVAEGWTPEATTVSADQVRPSLKRVDASLGNSSRKISNPQRPCGAKSNAPDQHPSTALRAKKLAALESAVIKAINQYPEECRGERGKYRASEILETIRYRKLLPLIYKIPTSSERWEKDVKGIIDRQSLLS